MEYEEIGLNPDLDKKLVESLQHPGDFLYDLSFVWALQVYPVLAPQTLFQMTVNDLQVLPVFTTQEDWRIFMSKLQGAALVDGWVERPLIGLLNEIKEKELPIDTIGFNLKTASDAATPNTEYFNLDQLIAFINAYGLILNVVETPENQNMPKELRIYYLPAYQRQSADGKITRVFPQMTSNTGKNFMPVFDRLSALAQWYQVPGFGDVFRENHGSILTTTFQQLKEPGNLLGGIDGIAINAESNHDALVYFDDDFDRSIIGQLPEIHDNTGPTWELPD